MQHLHFLYELPMIYICLATIVLAFVFNQIGYSWGAVLRSKTIEEDRTLAGSIQGSILGLLALILGFTFNMALQHFDARSEAVLQESNAIGTLRLRADALPAQVQGHAKEQIQHYIGLRVKMGSLDLSRVEQRNKLSDELAQLQDQMWVTAIDALRINAAPSLTGAYATSMTEVFDNHSRRTSMLMRYVPDIIIGFLVFVFCIASMNMGYSSGLSGRRVLVPTLIVILLITSIFYIALDIDRPRRGLIQVNQESMAVLNVTQIKQDDTQKSSQL